MTSFLKIMALCWKYGSERVLASIKEDKVDLFTTAYRPKEFVRIFEERRVGKDVFLLYVEPEQYYKYLKKRGRSFVEDRFSVLVSTIQGFVYPEAVIGRWTKSSFVLFLHDKDKALEVAKKISEQNCKVGVVKIPEKISLEEGVKDAEYDIYRRRVLKVA